MISALAPIARKVLLHPLAILSGLLLGGLYGMVDSGNSPLIAGVGSIYLKLLQMCVIPLLFTAVVTSLGKLFSDGAAYRYIGRLVATLVLGLVVAGGLAIVLGIFGQPGAELQQDAKRVIGEVILRAESASGAGTVSRGFGDIVVGMVPENIFMALSTGNMLAILFFAILFGVALGSIGRERAARAIELFETLYETFIKIISWLMYVLPFGLFCLAYSQVSDIGVEVLVAMTRLVLLMYLGAVLLILFYAAIIWLRAGGSPWQVLGALREAIFVAFGTSSSFAAVPAALRGLKDGMKVDRRVVDLVMPLGITLNPPGSVFHFALATLFLGNLYGVHLGFEQMALVLLGSMLAGVAAAGAPGVAALSMISIILVPLGLPVEVAIILLVAIDPIVDPILTVVNVMANAATTVLLGREGRTKPGKGAVEPAEPAVS